jgi:hypothetical protein
MGRYDSQKLPFHVNLNQWASRRVNSRREQDAKSMPCHVVKVDKDFITVAFETSNSVFTPPTVKIPQSWSQYSREPTQVGDKGYAVPGDYYLGGVTGDSGGNTDFYPRGNLTTLSFNGVSHKQNPDRDYDQLTHMGGPNGWVVGPHQKQQQDQQQQNGGQNGGGQSSVSAMRALGRSQSFRNAQARYVGNPRAGIPPIPSIPGIIPPAISGIISQVQGIVSQITGLVGQVEKDLTQFSFDKVGKALMQSKDDKHNVTVDQQNKTVSMASAQTIFHDPSDSGKVYIGGNPKQKFARIMTESGPSKWGVARIG